MYHLTVENAIGEQLKITDNEASFILTSITGLNPPNSNIATSSIAGMDGSLFNSSKIESRNITFTVKILGDIETNRQLLYRYIKSKGYLKLHIESRNRSVYIDGYVESAECDVFTDFETMLVSVICPDPLFKDEELTIIDVTNATKKFMFPFFIEKGYPLEFGSVSSRHIKEFEYEGDESGVEITITASGWCKNPIIRNIVTGDEMVFDMTLYQGDQLWVNTNKGRKKALYNDYVNAFKWIRFGSKWLYLQNGMNYIYYGAEDGAEALDIIFSFEKKYQGV